MAPLGPFVSRILVSLLRRQATADDQILLILPVYHLHLSDRLRSESLIATPGISRAAAPTQCVTRQPAPRGSERKAHDADESKEESTQPILESSTTPHQPAHFLYASHLQCLHGPRFALNELPPFTPGSPTRLHVEMGRWTHGNIIAPC